MRKQVEPDYKRAKRGGVMTDLERLNETIDWLDHQPHAEAYTAAKELRAYADLLADGERVWWCEEHQDYAPEHPYWASCRMSLPSNPPCRIVSKLLINPPTEEE